MNNKLKVRILFIQVVKQYTIVNYQREVDKSKLFSKGDVSSVSPSLFSDEGLTLETSCFRILTKLTLK